METSRIIHALGELTLGKDAPAEHKAALGLWNTFARLLHDCFNNGNNRWAFLQSVCVDEFRLRLRALPEAPSALLDFLDTEQEETEWMVPLQRVPDDVLETGGFDMTKIPGAFTENSLAPVQEALAAFCGAIALPPPAEATADSKRTAAASNSATKRARRVGPSA
jgi:hypothetical protein